MLFTESFESAMWFESWGLKEMPRNVTQIETGKSLDFETLKGKSIRILIEKDGHYGTSFSFDFKKQWGEEPEAIYFRYHIFLANNWNPQGGGKFPGISGTYTVAGWGGRPSHGDDGWSARGLFKKSVDGETPVGFYAYHADMRGKYGDNWLWNLSGSNGLETGRWYAIEQYAQLNTPGKKNGVLKTWVDDQLVFEKHDIRMRTIERLKIESIWINFYYGGSWAAPSDMHVYLDEITISDHRTGGK